MSDEWRQCAEWIFRCGLIEAGHELLQPSATCEDLVSYLNNGVALCQLVELFTGNTVNYVGYTAGISDVLTLRNISIFIIHAERDFGLNASDLFEPNDLFCGEDFKKVLQTLSKISHSTLARRTGIAGFPPDERKNFEDHEYYNTLEASTLKLRSRSRASSKRSDNFKEEKIYQELIGTVKRQPSQQLERAAAIRELLETEERYIEFVKTILDVFEIPLSAHLTPEQQNTFFGNIKKFADIHQTFYTSLKQYIEADRQFGQIFCAFKNRFFVYGEYCAELGRMQELVDHLTTTNGQFRRTLSDCETNPEHRLKTQRQRFKDLLAMPFQRITKYHLILETLVKKSARNQQGHLFDAHMAMKDVCDYVNEVKRHSEVLSRIQNVQACLRECWLPDKHGLQEFGHLLIDGEIKVASFTNDTERLKARGRAKLRCAFLLHKVLIITKMPWGKFTEETFTLKFMLRMREYKLVNELDRHSPVTADKWSYKFLLMHRPEWHASPSHDAGSAPVHYVFYAKTEEIKQNWIQAIQQLYDDVLPAGLTRNNHQFVIHTFQTVTSCSVCQLLLKGLIFQGYRCENCSAAAHKNCLLSTNNCPSPHLVTQNLSRQPSALVSQMNNAMDNGPSNRFRNAFRNVSSSSLVSPPPLAKNPSSPPFCPPPVAPPQTGFVPMATTHEETSVPSGEDLTVFPWFAGRMGSEKASRTLNLHASGTFLVRISDNPQRCGGYSISFKYNDTVYHIKIVVTHSLTKAQLVRSRHPGGDEILLPKIGFYIVESFVFPTISELVAFYQVQNLQDYFRGCDTTLRYPYKSEEKVRARGNSVRPPQRPPPMRRSASDACVLNGPAVVSRGRSDNGDHSDAGVEDDTGHGAGVRQTVESMGYCVAVKDFVSSPKSGNGFLNLRRGDKILVLERGDKCRQMTHSDSGAEMLADRNNWTLWKGLSLASKQVGFFYGDYVRLLTEDEMGVLPSLLSPVSPVSPVSPS